MLPSLKIRPPQIFLENVANIRFSCPLNLTSYKLAIRSGSSIAFFIVSLVVAMLNLVLTFTLATPASADPTVPTVGTATQEQGQPVREVQWQEIGEDIELGSASLVGSTLLGTDLKLVRTSLRRFGARIILATTSAGSDGTAHIADLAHSSGATVAINANFFDLQHRPLGLIVRNGSLIQPIHRGGGTLTGVFAILRGRPAIMSRSEFSLPQVSEAIQAGPRLLADGAVVPDLRATTLLAKRSAVCLDYQNRLVLACTAAGFVGLSIDQLVYLLQDPKINCREALNLDGGGSAQFFVSGSKTSLKDDLIIEGRDAVPVALGLFERG